MYLFFDTETSGLPDMKASPTADGQPHICQLGAILCDEHGFAKAEVNLLVRPDGWAIPQSTTDIHGISQNSADRYGLSIKGVLSIFDRLMTKAEVLVAHNIKFDLFMIEIERSRAKLDIELPKRFACTMNDSRNIVKIPPTPRMIACGMMEFKKPNLQEAYRHFFGRDFDGAHDAMADVRACRDVFFQLEKFEPLEKYGPSTYPDVAA